MNPTDHQIVADIVSLFKSGEYDIDHALADIRKALTPPSPEDFTFPVTVLFADEQTRHQFIMHVNLQDSVIVTGDEANGDEDEYLDLAARLGITAPWTITLAFETDGDLDLFARSVQERNAVSILTGAGNYYNVDADVVRP